MKSEKATTFLIIMDDPIVLRPLSDHYQSPQFCLLTVANILQSSVPGGNTGGDPAVENIGTPANAAGATGGLG